MDAQHDSYRDLLDIISDAYYETDLEGNLRDCNDAYARLFGHNSRAEMMGFNYLDALPPEDARKITREHRSIYETGKPCHDVRISYHRPDGQIGHVEISATLLRGADGKAIGFRGLVRDISDLVESIDALESVVATSATLYQLSKQLVEATNTADMLAILSNPAIESGAVETSLWYFTGGYDQEPTSATCVAVWGNAKTTVGQQISRDAFPYAELWLSNQPTFINDIEAELENSAARQFYLDAGIQAVLAMPLYHVDHWVGVLFYHWDQPHHFSEDEYALYDGLAAMASPAVDGRRFFEELEQIIEHRTAQLQESEQQHRLIAETITDVITRLEPENGFIHTYVSPAVRKILGYEPHEILGRSPEPFLHPEDYRKLAPVTQTAIDNPGERVKVLYRFRHKLGHYVWLETHAQVVTNPITDKAEYIAVSRDATAQVETERAIKQARDEALAASQAKSSFLANMSHEFRTPLNAILGFAELLERDETLATAQLESLRVISNSGKHLLSLINDVLEMSKIEAGQTVIKSNSTDLYQMLSTLEEMLYLRSSKKKIKLVFQREEDVPRYINADSSKLRQVILNLVGNAIKFTDEGTVTLSISKREGRLRFEVKDTGVGISPAEMRVIFEPFGQTKSGREASTGTGLGLAISRSFVRLMGGDIYVTSQKGQGSTFTFDIALAPVDMDPTHNDDDKVTRQVVGLAPGQRAYRILIVEDNRDNRTLLVKILKPLGFDVREAVNGQEAIEIAAAWQPDFIFMDMQLPVMDGYTATKRIKANDKDAKIVAITASAFEHDRSAILAAGCDDFIRKPYRHDEILVCLERALGVEFLYRSLSPTSPQADTLSPGDLQRLPTAWRQALFDAANQLDTQQVISLIGQIAPTEPTLAQALMKLSDSFDYETLITLTEH